MYLTDFPIFIPVSAYDLAAQRMVRKLRQQDGVASIFQIGNTKNLGISDIDMLVVFEDSVRCSLNPLEGLSKTDRYLFSHSLYGISKMSFSQAHRYTFFHNYNLLWGKELLLGENDLSGDEIQILKTQTALEYLIKMFVSSTVELTYGIVKVRGLLMHAKALSYDLEFLNVSTGRLFDLIQSIILWRDQWFEKKPDKQTLKQWIQAFYAELTALLETTLQTVAFYLPDWANLRIASNVMLVPSEGFGYRHRGTRLPAILRGLGRRYFNIQHRFNKFSFLLPITSEDHHVQNARFEYQKKMKNYKTKYINHFSPLNSCLNVI